MPVIFEKNTGRVSYLLDKCAEGSFALAMPDPKITFASQKCVITRVGVSAAGNFQFLHTIGNDVYVYVFGDRMGAVQLSGIAFQTTSKDGSGKHGFESLFDWYEQNRIAVRSTPVSVTVGRNLTFKGFVTGLTGDIQDTLRRTISFQISIAVLPEKAGAGGGASLAMDLSGGLTSGGLA